MRLRSYTSPLRDAARSTRRLQRFERVLQDLDFGRSAVVTDDGRYRRFLRVARDAGEACQKATSGQPRIGGMPDQHLGVKMARRVAYDCSLKGASCASQVNSLNPKREVCLGLERTKMLLEQIGADARIRELFEPHAAQRLKLGRVSFAAHEQYRVYLEDGDYEAVPARGCDMTLSSLRSVTGWQHAKSIQNSR